MAINLSQSMTKDNLMRAFAGESQARNRYTFSSNVAKNQKMYVIQQVFDLTAHQEQQHAKIFFDLLKELNGTSITVDGGYPVGNYDDLGKLLRDSQHNEYQEHNVVYPDFARVARDEGFANIATTFENIAAIEKIHGDRFGAFAELIEQGKLFKSDTETEWLCLNCGHIHKGIEAPKKCPVCSHDQGFFVPAKFYNFIASNYSK